MFDFLRKSKNDMSDISIQPTNNPYMAAYREGCPCAGDPPTLASIDVNSPEFKRGYADGRQSFESLRTNYPHMIVDGVIREDTGEE